MQKSTLREYVESILIAAVLALFIRTFVFQAFKIPTGSMEPNLLVGDHIVVNKFIYGPSPVGWADALLPMRDIQRGDVIVFRAPEEPDKDFIKRVVAVGGDKIEVRDGVVYINDEAVDEPFAHHTTTYGTHRDQKPTLIPEGQYFCMGDNRDNSRDSRYWGTVPHHLVKGRAMFVYWSIDTPSGAYFVTGLDSRIRETQRMLTHFFTRTRWDRTFHMIR